MSTKARTRGKVLWCVTRTDLFAPSLHQVGLSPDRVIYFEAGDEKAVLAACEEGLRHGGFGAVVVGGVHGGWGITRDGREVGPGCGPRTTEQAFRCEVLGSGAGRVLGGDEGGTIGDAGRRRCRRVGGRRPTLGQTRWLRA